MRKVLTVGAAWVLVAVLCAAAGWAGAWTALRSIPEAELRPRSLLPVGATYVLKRDVPVSVNARALRDWHFARENGLTPPVRSGEDRVFFLRVGSRVVVERGDLSMVLVRAIEPPGEVSVWARAEDIASRGGEDGGAISTQP